MLEAATPRWIIGITTGILVGGLSLLFFPNPGHRPLPRPPHPGIALTDGALVAHWNGAMGFRSAPQLAVIRFADTTGRARLACHLVQQHPTVLGTMGQVQLNRRLLEQALRFNVGPPDGRKAPQGGFKVPQCEMLGVN